MTDRLPPLTETAYSAHLSDHNHIAHTLNTLVVCPLCGGLIRHPNTDRHRLAHIARAVAAR